MARKGHTNIIYKGTFISKQSLDGPNLSFVTPKSTDTKFKLNLDFKFFAVVLQLKTKYSFSASSLFNSNTEIRILHLVLATNGTAKEVGNSHIDFSSHLCCPVTLM